MRTRPAPQLRESAFRAPRLWSDRGTKDRRLSDRMVLCCNGTMGDFDPGPMAFTAKLETMPAFDGVSCPLG